MRATWIAAVWALVAGACAPAAINTPSAQQMAESRAKVRAAEEIGARHSPQSALYLKLARDDLAAADKGAAEHRMGDSARALERANVDAELALMLTRDQNQRTAAAEARRKADELSAQLSGEPSSPPASNPEKKETRP